MLKLDFSFGGIEFPALQLANGDWIFNANTVCLESKLVNDNSNVSRWVKSVLPRKYYLTLNDAGIVGRPGLYLYEAGLYSCIFQSETQDAIDFKEFVLEVVLPSIRKQGIFIEESRFSAEEKAKLDAIVSERDLRISRLELEKQMLVEESFAIKMAFDDSIRESKVVKKNLEVKLATEVENNHVFASEAELQLNARSRIEQELFEVREKLKRATSTNSIPSLPPYNEEYGERFRRMVFATKNLVKKASNTILKGQLEIELKKHGFSDD